VFKVPRVGLDSGSEVDSDASASDSGEEEEKKSRPVRRRAAPTRRPARSAIPAPLGN